MIVGQPIPTDGVNMKCRDQLTEKVRAEIAANLAAQPPM